MVGKSVTNQEIARYWKQKHMVEEDHLFAAIKSAARLRSNSLSVDDYLQFQESLKEDGEVQEKCKSRTVVVGVKDWWTNSKYAYLNQPAVVNITDSSSSSIFV